MGFDMDKGLEKVKKCKLLTEDEFLELCDKVTEILCEEANVVPVSSPITVCGDVHGQFYDVMELFRQGGELPDTNYVFMGDYVDRGYYSLETATLLLLLKAKYSDRVTLLRGNHETRQITQIYGFYEECERKYGNATVWHKIMDVFDFLTIAAVVDNSVLCIHGGLSPDLRTLDHIRLLHRNEEVPHQGPFSDVVWSDPEGACRVWAPSPRGAGNLFGKEVVAEFNHTNNLTMIARAHQLVDEGYQFPYGDDHCLVTVWSAPNYCYRCGNVAAIMQLNGKDSVEFKVFKEVPEDQRVMPPRNAPLFFL